jgi:hypothetical protein
MTLQVLKRRERDMKRMLLGLLSLLLAGGVAQAAELYRWVDEHGKVHYSDTPPPPQVRTAERKRLGDRPGDANLPYALQQAMKNYPLTLYTANECGDACRQAAAHLVRRGAPYTEKNARDPDAADALMKLAGGKLEVPVLTVGRTPLRGYEEGAWNTALDSAGYPRTAAVPAAAVRRPAKETPQPSTAEAPSGEPRATAQ